ncbi:MAG: DMT family transporter [Acidimicrobiia bacterium]|nr:DMT family transporter [Acidimicrobiia bacterium]MDH3469960.1 DMT family transporter [Acidimicrobiia bacterium]
MAIFLAAMSAVVWGGSDFLGGIATKKRSVLRVLLVSQFFSLGLAVVAAPLFDSSGLDLKHLAWGAGAGSSGIIGLALLYRGLAMGRMAVVAPLTAVTGSIVPIVVGVALGERPSALAWLGVAIALPSVVLISRTPDSSSHQAVSGVEVSLGLASGAFFGLFGVFIAQTPEASGLWPLIAAKVAAIAMVAGVVAAAKPARGPRGDGALLAATGLGDMVANILILAAFRRGLLSLVPVVGALYPASTIVLARLVLGERIHAVQAVGLVTAATAVGLIAAG